MRALTVIIPAFNEAEHIADTIASLRQQSLQPQRIVVVDDGSTDGTGEIARTLGVEVVRPPRNTGSKAGAQNFALGDVTTELTMAIDADTTLDPCAIERLLSAFDDPRVAATCGSVLPRHVRTLWERGRFVEYLLAFGWYKPIQDYYERPLIASGCFSAYRTSVLKSVGGWSRRTMAEDMDLTWTFYEQGYAVRFIGDALCYPIEPYNFRFMSRQLKRWSHGYVQNVRLHWRGVVAIPYLRAILAVSLWDAAFASIFYLVLLPVLAIVLAEPRVLLGYVIDLPVILLPAVLAARRSGTMLRALASVPAFFVLRQLNAVMFLRAMIAEWVFDRPLLVYEKGH